MAEGLPKIGGRAITSPGSIQNAGAADRAAASMFGRVAQSAMQIGNALEPLAVKAGEDDAVRDFVEQDKLNEGRGPGKVTKRSGFLGLQTAGDVSYNNMMETLYLQKTKGALETEAQNLANRVDTFGDVDAFDKDFSGFAEGLGSEIDPEFAEEFYLLSEKVQAETRTKIAGAKQQADIAEAKTSMDMNLSSLEDEILAAELAGASIGDSGRALDGEGGLYQEYQNQLVIKTRNPLYQYSPVESERDLKAFKVKVTAATLTPELRDYFETEGYAKSLQWADDQASGMGLPPAETSTLRNALRNEVNLLRQNQEAIRLEEKAKEDAAKAAREAAAEEADRRVTDARLQNLPEDELRSRLAIARNYVTPERYDTLADAVLNPKNKEPMQPGNYAYLLLEAKRGNLDYDTIINLPGDAAQLSRLVEETEAYENTTIKGGRDTIKAYFSKADGLMGQLEMFDEAQKLKVSEQEAYDDLSAWWSAATVDPSKPPPRPSEVSEEAKRIVARYGRIDSTVVKSRFLAVAPGGNYSAESVSAGKTALKDAVRQGRISQEDAADELAKIELVEQGLN